MRTATGFGNRNNIAGNNITNSGVINVNNSGNGVGPGGWVIVNTLLNSAGTINVNSGVFATDGNASVTGSAIVNVAPGGVFSNHDSTAITIGALNGAGDVTPAQGGNGTFNLTSGRRQPLGHAFQASSTAPKYHGRHRRFDRCGLPDADQDRDGRRNAHGREHVYSGSTAVNAGTLSIFGGGSIAASAVTVNANGTLNVANTAQGFNSRATMIGNNVSGSGVININNSGSGISGGWVRVNTGSALNFSGTMQYQLGRLRNRRQRQRGRDPRLGHGQRRLGWRLHESFVLGRHHRRAQWRGRRDAAGAKPGTAVTT